MLALGIGLGSALAASCGGAERRDDRPLRVYHGKAAWYGGKHHGGPTASGERFNKNALTAAHRTLRMNSRVRVTNKRNGKSVVVRINDRGPFGRRERIIDLSEAAARRIDMIKAGVVPIELEVLEEPPPRPRKRRARRR